MNILSKFREATITNGKRVLKLLGVGGDVLTAKESMPWGWDSQPTGNVNAVYCTTTNMKDRFVVGYVNNAQLAGEGESRHYAVDGSGAVVSYVWTKANGNTEINGNQYSATRYQTLETQLQSFITQVNSQWPLIASGIATGGGSYAPTNVSVDFSTAESETVKIK